ncbi:MAG: T9SS type A sorting domain-containing protein, partial [Bacteroidota bacterium]
CFDLSNGISVDRYVVNGGTISTEDSQILCAFGDPGSAAISFSVSGSAGDARAWLATDLSGNIEIIQDNGNFDFTNAGVGASVIFYMRWEPGNFSGLEVGNSLLDLEGCFDLSNGLLVIRLFSSLCFEDIDFVAFNEEKVESSAIPNGDYLREVLAQYSSIDTDNIAQLAELDRFLDQHAQEVNVEGVVNPQILPTEEMELTIFPNPVNDQLNIQANFPAPTTAEVEIFSALGQRTYAKKFQPNKALQTTIDLTELPDGTYYLILQTDAGVRKTQFIKR